MFPRHRFVRKDKVVPQYSLGVMALPPTTSVMKSVLEWLKTERLHKYWPVFSRMTYQTIIGLDDDTIDRRLSEMHAIRMPDGARGRVLRCAERLRARPAKLDAIDETTPPEEVCQVFTDVLKTPLSSAEEHHGMELIRKMSQKLKFMVCTHNTKIFLFPGFEEVLFAFTNNEDIPEAEREFAKSTVKSLKTYRNSLMPVLISPSCSRTPLGGSTPPGQPKISPQMATKPTSQGSMQPKTRTVPIARSEPSGQFPPSSHGTEARMTPSLQRSKQQPVHSKATLDDLCTYFSPLSMNGEPSCPSARSLQCPPTTEPPRPVLPTAHPHCQPAQLPQAFEPTSRTSATLVCSLHPLDTTIPPPSFNAWSPARCYKQSPAVRTCTSAPSWSDIPVSAVVPRFASPRSQIIDAEWREFQPAVPELLSPKPASWPPKSWTGVPDRLSRKPASRPPKSQPAVPELLRPKPASCPPKSWTGVPERLSPKPASRPPKSWTGVQPSASLPLAPRETTGIHQISNLHPMGWFQSTRQPFECPGKDGWPITAGEQQIAYQLISDSYTQPTELDFLDQNATWGGKNNVYPNLNNLKP